MYMNILQHRPKLHNTFYIESKNIVTGEIKNAIAENVVCNSYFMATGYTTTGSSISFGKGTKEPAVTDTGLASSLFSVSTSAGSYYRIDENTCMKRLTATVPATSSYVGTITEVGLSAGGGFFNRALLKDAEGNLISINKTDLDQLTVTIEVYFVRDTDHGFLWSIGRPSLFNRFGSIRNLWFGFKESTFSTYSAGSIALTGTKGDEYWPHTFVSMEAGKPSVDSTNLTRTLSTHRFGTDAGNTHYINGITYFGVYSPSYGSGSNCCEFHQTFPNDIFGQVEIKDISVGTGDGAKTDFEPPLGLWVKDTDVLYVDGVKLTRGVDYTIDNRANRTKMWEITPGNIVKKATNELTGTWPGSFSLSSLRIPFTAAYESSTITQNSAEKPLIRKDSALLIELQDDAGIEHTVNYWIPGYWNYITETDSSSKTATNVTLTLSYSTDGNSYTEVDSVLLSNDTAKTTQRDFAAVTAKYWKLEIKDGADKAMYFNGTYSSSTPTVSMLGYYGDPIKFTTPPAAGAVITMDCALDRPYKNENFVIDYACTWQF